MNIDASMFDEVKVEQVRLEVNIDTKLPNLDLIKIKNEKALVVDSLNEMDGSTTIVNSNVPKILEAQVTSIWEMDDSLLLLSYRQHFLSSRKYTCKITTHPD